jgi:excisionase family DNA binding protein
MSKSTVGTVPTQAAENGYQDSPIGKSMSTQPTVGSSATPQIFEPLLDSREAAALLHVHYKTLERKARCGEIPGYQIAGRWYFRVSELDAWVRSQLNSSPANLVRKN